MIENVSFGFFMDGMALFSPGSFNKSTFMFMSNILANSIILCIQDSKGIDVTEGIYLLV